MARVLGRDARRRRPVRADGDRRCAARRRRRVRGRPGGDRARPLSGARRPDRPRPPARRPRPLAPAKVGRANAIDHLLEGLTAADSALPRHSGLAALEAAASRTGSTAASPTAPARPGRSGRILDEREDDRLALELWLQAEDDPTLGLPASLLWSGDDVFGFLRAGDPRRDLIDRLGELEPLLADVGIEFDAVEPPRRARVRAGAALPARGDAGLEERGVPVLLPASWLRSPARVKVNLAATASPRRARAAPLADRAGAVRLAARGRRHRADGRGARRARRREGAVRPHRRALARRSPLDVEKALRFLDRRQRAPGSSISFAPSPGSRRRGRGRARRGLARRVALLLAGERRFRSLPTPAAMTPALPVPGARARLAAAARRPRRRRDPRRRHGPRQDRAGDRDARLRARGRRRGELGRRSSSAR